tara:strand:+ start:234 stop:467 length:234 start_codon:yes stop_codon:yes gene_type:complete
MNDMTKTNYECFVTGKLNPADEYHRFTSEFDAWVSKEGEQHIYNAAKTGELDFNAEWRYIYNEWVTQDGAESNRKTG